MTGEPKWKRDKRKQRQEALYSELQFADAGEVLEIDRQRRKRGERPSSFGLAIEGAYARSRPPDFVPPDRGVDRLGEFRRLSGREPNDFERQQIDLAAETTLGAERAQEFAPGGGTRFVSTLATEVDRYTGAPVRGFLKGGPRGAAEGFLDPSSASGRDIIGIRNLPDRDIIGGLSPRDIAGGGAEVLADVGVVGGIAKGLGRAGIRAATRQGVEEAAETSTRGLLRDAGTPGAVEPVIPGQRPGLRRAVSGGAVQPATATRPAYAQPPPTAQALYGLEPFEVGLSRFDETMNSIAETLGRAPVREEYATPVMRERARVQPRIAAQAERLGAVADSLVNDAFEIDKQGRIPSLAGIASDIPGAPTLADIAARLPNYEAVLTPAQRQAVDTLQRELAPYRQMLDEVGVEVGSRPDVMPGGFYVPRGGADLEGIDQPFRPRGRGRPGGKTGSERVSVFESQAAGIEAGFEYAPVGDALRTYGRAVGERAVDRHVLNYFTALEEGGVRLARSAVDEMDPTLRARWQTFRSSIAGVRQTARRRTVRTVERMGEAERAARAETQAEGRAVRAEERMVARKATIEELDISGPAAVRDQLPTTAELRAEAARLRNRIRQTPAGAVSSAGENRRLVQRIGELEALADLRNAAEQVGDDVDAMLARVEESADRAGNYVQTRLDPSLRAQARRDARLEGRTRGGVRRGAGSLNADAPIEGPLAAVKAYEAALTRILESERFDLLREASTDDVIKAAERELRVLQRELSRTATRARGASNRAGRAMAAEAETRQRLDSLLQQQDALRADYQRAQRKASETPRGRGRLDIAGAQAFTFPEALADAVSDALRREQPRQGLTADLRALNGVMRGLKATGEFSHLSIQLAVGAVRSPRRYGRATVVAMKAMKDPRVAGAYIRQFDVTRAQRGLPASRQWVAGGLQIGGSTTEFQVARGGLLSPARIPGVGRLARAFDRNFGVAGDVMRLELADVEAEWVRGTGGVLDEAEIARISTNANRMTGWVPSTGFASRADAALAVVNFAPRFLRARIEAVAQLASRDPRMRQLARRTIGRYIAVASAMTVLANAANGERTDFNPVRNIDGRWVKNGNFIRIRNIAGRDWSLLGPFDGLLGIAVGVGDVPLALASAPGAGRAETKDRLVGDVQSLITAPLPDFVRTLWTGRNAIGEPIGIPELLLESVTPIGYTQGAEGMGQIGQAQTPQGKVAEAVGSLTEAALGARATPLSVTDRLDIAARDLGLEQPFYELSPSQQQQVTDANPDLRARRSEERVERGDELGRYEHAKSDHEAEQRAAYAAYQQDGDARKLRDLWRDQDLVLAGRAREIFGERDTADDPKAEPWRRYYAAIARARRPDGSADFNAVEAWRATLDPTDDAEIDVETGLAGIPERREQRQVSRALAQSGLFELHDNAWATMKRQEAFSQALGPYEEYEDWWRATRDRTAQQIADAKGWPLVVARDEADRAMQSQPIVKARNELVDGLETQWANKNTPSGLAEKAVEWGYFRPTADQRELIGSYPREAQPVGAR